KITNGISSNNTNDFLICEFGNNSIRLYAVHYLYAIFINTIIGRFIFRLISTGRDNKKQNTEKPSSNRLSFLFIHHIVTIDSRECNLRSVSLNRSRIIIYLVKQSFLKIV